ncbi:MAG: helix-turn-helix transcriptional regulator [Burkholderiaceae bacterium]
MSTRATVSSQRVFSTAGAPGSKGFGAMLRSWRQLRRVSQLDLSLECAVSQRHLSFLESGRARPSRQMVLHLAEALEVPLRDRNGMLGAAGFAAEFRESALEGAAMEPVREALLRMLRFHEPFPAVVVDRDFGLRLANRAFDRLLSLLGDPDEIWRQCCGEGPRNILLLTLSARGARAAIGNFDVVAPVMLNRAWHEAVARGGEISPALRALRDDPSLAAHWRRSDAIEHAMPVVPLTLQVGGQSLSLFSMISTFGTPYDVTTDELRVESFFPADAASEQTLRALADAESRA